MRPKVLLSAFVAGGLLVGLAVWLANLPPALPASKIPAPAPPEFHAPGMETSRPPLPPARESEILPTVDTNAGDILANLEKPGLEVHQAALQRVRELDDRTLIPRLREVAARIDDAQEKADILDTVDFLSLPSIDEAAAADQAARTAAGQPELPHSPTNRWTGRPFSKQ